MRGETTARESVAKVTEVEELMVAIGGKLLVIDAKRIAHRMEQASDGARAHPDTKSASAMATLVVVRRDPFSPVMGFRRYRIRVGTRSG
jgi:hypothetical protein